MFSAPPSNMVVSFSTSKEGVFLSMSRSGFTSLLAELLRYLVGAMLGALEALQKDGVD